MPQSEPIRVLCLEDDPGTARLLQKTLNHAGHLADLAHDGEEGLTLYKSGSYDVLCIDHHMPGLTGLEIIRTLAREECMPPIVMITGAGDESVAVEAIQLGASDYVIKDSGNRYFDLIPSAVEGALERQRLLREKRLAEEALQKSHDELEARVRERTADLARINDELRMEVAQRKQAEQEIRRQHEFLGSVLESLTHPFYVVDANDFAVVMANSAAGLKSSTGRTTCYALTHHRDLPCESHDCPCPVMEVKKSNRPVMVEHVHYDGEGNQRVFEIHAYPLLDPAGTVTRVIEYALDVTDRKKAEDKLKELLETFSNIVKNIPAGLLIYQYQAPNELFLVNVNREATRLTGITVDQWRGQEFDEMWPNARIQGLTKALLNTMATGETFAMECAVFKTDDIERFLRLRAFSMPGELLGLTFEDITELKQMERGIQKRAVHGMVPDAPVGRRKVSDRVPPKAPNRALRLLLIADRPVVAGILQKGLTRLGQSAVVVTSGHEALDSLLAQEFSAIVCDLTDSETAGQQAAGLIEDLCRETGISRPPFVLMAEAVRDKDVSPRPGVDLIVEKPIDVGRLLQVLHEVV
ncbi:MAG: response regulator [Pseudomonadota bacterium]